MLTGVKLAHLVFDPQSQPQLAVVVHNRAFSVRDLGIAAQTLQDFIALGDAAERKLRSALQDVDRDTGVDLDSVTFAPAVINPPITLAVGLNYDEHASELNLDNDAGVVLFSLFPNSLNAHNAEVVLPTHLTQEVDYEGELGVIIGKPARNVPVAEALDYVFGYTAINDLTARNIQFQEPQWSRCKSFDTFTPVGPYVVTASDIPDPQALKITTDVDDLRVQDSSTKYMIRSVAKLISELSDSTTLQPGTLISTGSPGGAGRSRKPQLFLADGTVVTVTIEKIGALTNRCVSE